MTPKLRIDILQEIKKLVDIPLVLHGGSANPDEEISAAVKMVYLKLIYLVILKKLSIENVVTY